MFRARVSLRHHREYSSWLCFANRNYKMMKLKGFLALFHNPAYNGTRRSFQPYCLQPIKLGNRMVELPVNHCFNSQQFVDLLPFRQEQMIC